MIISDKEREILGLSDDSELAYKTEDIILDTYFDPNSDRLKVLYDCIKRLIIEYLQKKNIEVDENVSFNLDDLLKEIIKIDEDLPSFDLSLYDDPNKLDAYFRNITNNISFEDISHIKVIFDNMNDGFRAYFAKYVPKFPVIVSSLLLELQEREPDPIFDNLEFVSSSDVFDSDDDWDLSDFEFDEDEWETSSTPKEEPLTPENLIDYLKFINVVFTLTRYRQNGIDASDMMFELIREKKLDYYYSDKDFMKLFDRIMEHDKSKHRFYFHGTQCIEDAEHILEEGLGVLRDNLSSTAYSELSQEELLLYSRGFLGEIGRDAVVIIDVPISDGGREENLLQEVDPSYETHFNLSGLQGLNGDSHYIVYPEHIVGFVNKRDKKIVFNPNYKNYARFMSLEDEDIVTDESSKTY